MLVVKPGSRLWLHGNSTLHEYEIAATAIRSIGRGDVAEAVLPYVKDSDAVVGKEIARALDRPVKAVERCVELIRKLDPQTVSRLAGADVTVEVVGDQIILQGPEEAVAAIELIIRGLDQDMSRKQKAIEVVTVSERDANEIARSVEQSLQNALARPNQTAEEKLKITALSSNILLVSALPEDIDLVLDTIEKVDAIPDPLGKVELMRFEVQHRKAGDVAKDLEKILTQLRTATGQKKEQSKLQIIPNNASNTITVC
jgi:type II secretory pathway component GspD/PulD (secretin)